MLKVKDTIKQIKPIEGFNFVGEKFQITNIQVDSISFTNSKIGNGIMTYDEFGKYFMIWNVREWETVHRDVLDILNLECIHNNKKVIIRTKNKHGKKIRGTASCSPYDEFDLDYGFKLAFERFKENIVK